MPKYDYKCNACDETYVEVHSYKVYSSGCPSCQSSDVKKMISLFASRTERDLGKAFDKYAEQAVKDNERFHRDDKFAANLTGADDPKHQQKLQKVLREQQAKNKAAQEKIKRLENK